MNKHEREHRPRGLRQSGKPGGEERRRFAGIDIDGERHAVAVVDEAGPVLVKSTFSGEDAEGYRRVRDLLGDQHNCLVGMEATGHYWSNLFAFLVGHAFRCYC
jgi:transposase